MRHKQATTCGPDFAVDQGNDDQQSVQCTTSKLQSWNLHLKCSSCIALQRALSPFLSPGKSCPMKHAVCACEREISYLFSNSSRKKKESGKGYAAAGVHEQRVFYGSETAGSPLQTTLKGKGLPAIFSAKRPPGAA
eukprot:1160415-Pelagomonas_calceolata.AAC.3